MGIEIVALYQEMADHTAPECATVCRLPHSCCEKRYCEMALGFAKSRGVDLQPLWREQPIPFLHENGCVVPPHLRPICTLHTCAINAFGYKQGDRAWTDKYFEIRDRIDEEEWRQETSGILSGTP